MPRKIPTMGCLPLDNVAFEKLKQKILNIAKQVINK